MGARPCLCVVSLIIARYINWRVFTTVLPVHGAWHEIGWVWFRFAIEVFALFDALILYLTLLRTSDRHVEADSHEARLRALPPDQLPSVDVYIPTYNEPFEVLEKTNTGALCLDYPNARIWVLDDGRRPWLKTFCEAKGVGYLTGTTTPTPKPEISITRSQRLRVNLSRCSTLTLCRNGTF